MFVSIRRYFVHKALAKELAELVDRDFADRISGQPGFVSYEFLDGGEGEAMSISAFHDAGQAENSRALARRWVDEALSDLELTTLDSVHGEIRLTHATAARPRSAHPDAPAGFAAVRRARLAAGSVAEVVKRAEEFARQLETLPGFIAYQVMDCGDGDIIAVSHFRERTSAEQSDQLAARFAQNELQGFDLERNEWFGGGVILVSREADAAPPGERV
jgi:heme-degrading monooxygenase HmoA